MMTLEHRTCSAVLIMSVSALTGIGQAFAADLAGGPSLKDAPVLAEPNLWEGFYAGGHVGAGWSTTTVDDRYNYVGDPSSRNSVAGNDVIGGGQIGYNFRSGPFVFGPEIGIGYLGLSGDQSAALTRSPDCLSHYGANICGLNANYATSGGLYGELTARAGYAIQDVLLYAKGGAAFLDADIKSNYVGQNCSTARNCWLHPNAPVNPSTFSFENSDTMWGWTIGGGMEYALSRQWSVRLDYQHFDFGKMSFAYSGVFDIPGTPWKSKLSGNSDASITVDTVTVGLNYHF